MSSLASASFQTRRLEVRATEHGQQVAPFFAQKDVLLDIFQRDFMVGVYPHRLKNEFGEVLHQRLDEAVIIDLEVARETSSAEVPDLFDREQAVAVFVCQRDEQPYFVGQGFCFDHLHAADEFRPIHEVRKIIVYLLEDLLGQSVILDKDLVYSFSEDLLIDSVGNIWVKRGYCTPSPYTAAR